MTKINSSRYLIYSVIFLKKTAYVSYAEYHFEYSFYFKIVICLKYKLEYVLILKFPIGWRSIARWPVSLICGWLVVWLVFLRTLSKPNNIFIMYHNTLFFIRTCKIRLRLGCSHIFFGFETEMFLIRSYFMEWFTRTPGK